ncbi:MAG TPA: metallophosphoesterase family protein [Ensifer sp.]|nr:metallophosphoesterase family protein [Ensifer sp.]
MSAFKNTIAIGDIHGHAGLLSHLLECLTCSRKPGDSRFIFLGDVIDRGPQSARTMTRVCSVLERYPGSKFILGNHEEYFRNLLRGDLNNDGFLKWLWNGGTETLVSYGLDEDDEPQTNARIIATRFPEHVALLEGASAIEVMGRYCFVHAGIDPLVSLADQSERTTRWIRANFTDHQNPFEKIVVHGHSITASGFPEVFDNRIALDTGSYQTGRISAALFEDEELAGFVCVDMQSGKPKASYFDAYMQPVHPPSEPPEAEIVQVFALGKQL